MYFFFKTCSSLIVYANIYYVHNVHNSTVVDRGGGGLQGLSHYFPHFQQLPHSKGVQVIIGLKLKVRITSN